MLGAGAGTTIPTSSNACIQSRKQYVVTRVVIYGGVGLFPVVIAASSSWLGGHPFVMLATWMGSIFSTKVVGNLLGPVSALCNFVARFFSNEIAKLLIIWSFLKKYLTFRHLDDLNLSFDVAVGVTCYSTVPKSPNVKNIWKKSQNAESSRSAVENKNRLPALQHDQGRIHRVGWTPLHILAIGKEKEEETKPPSIHKLDPPLGMTIHALLKFITSTYTVYSTFTWQPKRCRT